MAFALFIFSIFILFFVYFDSTLTLCFLHFAVTCSTDETFLFCLVLFISFSSFFYSKRQQNLVKLKRESTPSSSKVGENKSMKWLYAEKANKQKNKVTYLGDCRWSNWKWLSQSKVNFQWPVRHEYFPIATAWHTENKRNRAKRLTSSKETLPSSSSLLSEICMSERLFCWPSPLPACAVKRWRRRSFLLFLTAIWLDCRPVSVRFQPYLDLNGVLSTQSNFNSDFECEKALQFSIVFFLFFFI